MGDILGNQHLLPLTTEVYQQMICHVVTHCAMMCGLDKREDKGVGLDTGERGLGGRWRGSRSHAASVVCVNN